ncbi:arylsulfatase [Bremerella cremea]|uniref:Arylsulfatase n=1 Tax=Bremerella cremea TaxID=1031537 RepID=A0A368KJX5_9BACT|nr:arylsulfatase [Bremerella cremea]RCS41059.1 arylsulfatase [Bremerella cremea]
MRHRLILVVALLSSLSVGSLSADDLPNIVYVLCDDLGYGDVQCLNPEHGKIKTPCADRLAAVGMIFTDAHSGSSVCTPTRYGLLTGRYSWRTKLQRGVVTGFAPCLIAESRPTVASFLREHGYQTAIIGKWHLNFQYCDPQTGKPYHAKQFKSPPVGSKIPDGPVARGFDYFHGFHHARDMQTVIENDRVIAHDPPINMLPRLTTKSVEYIDAHAQDAKPFFLYVALGSPHTPILPTADWQGKSGLGDYADFVMQTDNTLGEISQALARNGLTDNTLVIFTSDNGCSKAADIAQLAEQGHLVSGNLRGSKADIWEGGHRVPFIVRWPKKVPPGSTSNQLICHVDLFATVAEIVAHPIAAGSGEDSVSFLPVLSGEPINSTRAGVIHHSISGHFAYRQGPWKLALARASGGWTSPTEKEVDNNAPKAQLYHMVEDVGETSNRFLTEPDIAARLLAQLREDIRRGRSTAGPTSSNDTSKIILWKSGQK